MDLNRLDWDAAALELTASLHGDRGAASRRQLAAISSLRARFTSDHAVAVAAVGSALALEPLEPLHRVRAALAQLRFGDPTRAIAIIEALPDAVKDVPRVLYVKALATLRRGEPRPARNIADRAVQLARGELQTAARFLRVEATLYAQAKGGLDKLAELPRNDPALEPAWADLLAKLAILRPGDRRAVLAQLERGALTPRGRADVIVRQVLAWTDPQTTAAELAAAADGQPPGSRVEQVALALLAIKLSAEAPVAACGALRAILDRGPARASVRRTFTLALTRAAVAEASAERLRPALRVIQQCVELEPHEPVHLQNRAAAFTLLGEHDAALDAWAELERLNFRLALLGRLDPASAARYAAPHRMFSLAARWTRGGARGVFVVERDGDHQRIEADQDGLDRDPDLLRHWLHHSRAAIVFELIALGGGRDRLLLAPRTPLEAAARVRSLCALASSLAVLIPVEGRLLAERIAAHARAVSERAPMRYAPSSLDDDVQIVQRHVLELYADLAVLAQRWAPDPRHRIVQDEALETLRAVGPWLDYRALRALNAATASDRTPPSSLRRLENLIRSLLDLEDGDRDRELDPSQYARVHGVLLASLRVMAVHRRFHDGDHSDVDALCDELDLARNDDPENPLLERTAARVLAEGKYFDEAAAAIAAFHRITKGDHPWSDSVDKLGREIDAARERPGQTIRRHAAAVATAQLDLSELETALDAQPSSLRLYREMCGELAVANRWSDAHAWATRAIARCLSAANQAQARELALELRGLEQLAAHDRGAIAAYLAGARSSALDALAALPPGDCGLELVRGHALLAADRRVEARAAYARALEVCDRGLFIAVLRPLATDLERPLLEAARREIDASCGERRHADAYGLIAERMATVERAEPYLLELARVQVSAIVACAGTTTPPPGPPSTIRVDAAWSEQLVQALALPAPTPRARALIELARARYPEAERDALALTRKLDELDAQLAAMTALDASLARVHAGDLDGALAALEQLGPAGDHNARVIRQRVIVSLQLERHDAADQLVERMAALADPAARDFVRRYPRLRLGIRISKASASIRAREFERARALLAADLAADPDHELDLAHCRAFCAAAEGHQRAERGDRRAARELMVEALRWVDGVLPRARETGHARILELRRKLEDDVAALEGGLP